MTHIAIYVEGGGDTAEQKAELRRGFDGLFSDIKDRARQRQIYWKVVPCGSRNEAYDAFAAALEHYPQAVNILLVDSEDPVEGNVGDPSSGIRHLTKRDAWHFTAASAARVHLMAQCMEAWFVADIEALKGYYGANLAVSGLSKRKNLEQEPKPSIYNQLEAATKHTQKGAYHKIKHASALLQRLDLDTVRTRCPRIATLFAALNEVVANG